MGGRWSRYRGFLCMTRRGGGFLHLPQYTLCGNATESDGGQLRGDRSRLRDLCVYLAPFAVKGLPFRQCPAKPAKESAKDAKKNGDSHRPYGHALAVFWHSG